MLTTLAVLWFIGYWHFWLMTRVAAMIVAVMPDTSGCGSSG
jgi:hypothetical protein